MSTISFSANEPAVSFDYFLDIAAAAHEQGLLMGCSSNGLFSDAQIERLLPVLDAANLSIKGPDDDFYRQMCGGGSVERITRLIARLKAAGVHVEVTTPYVPAIGADDMLSIAGRIAAVDRAIPWHLFRLLPEYKLTDIERTAIPDMLELKRRAGELLDYVYLENFAASAWLDTHCPACGERLIERMTSRGCGGTYLESWIGTGKCPACGRPVDIRGAAGTPPDEEIPPADTRRAFIEVGGWTNVLDMGTGEPVDNAGPFPLHDLVSAHPYPGDLETGAETWVSDIARAVDELQHPDLMVLTYAQNAFAGRHRVEESPQILRETTDAVQSFLAAGGYEHLIIGLGDMVKNRGSLNLERVIDGVASADDGIACLYHAGPDDAARVADLEGVQRVMSRDEMLALLPAEEAQGLPGEFFIIPDEGYQILAFSSSSRYTYRVDALDKRIPVASSFEPPATISGVRAAIRERLAAGKRVALIMIDGVGRQNFPFEISAAIDNTIGGQIPLASSHHQFMLISTGRSIFPQCLGYPHWRTSSRVNPFARNTPPLPSCLTMDAIGAGKRAVSIGNRSIFTHAAFPADLTVECQCAGLHNYGSLVVLPKAV